MKLEQLYDGRGAWDEEAVGACLEVAEEAGCAWHVREMLEEMARQEVPTPEEAELTGEWDGWERVEDVVGAFLMEFGVEVERRVGNLAGGMAQ